MILFQQHRLSEKARKESCINLGIRLCYYVCGAYDAVVPTCIYSSLPHTHTVVNDISGMHYFVVRETRPRIRFPIGLRRWIYPVSYADRQNLSIRSSFIALLKQFPQLTLFPSGGRGCGILVKDVQSLVEPRILPAPQ